MSDDRPGDDPRDDESALGELLREADAALAAEGAAPTSEPSPVKETAR